MKISVSQDSASHRWRVMLGPPRCEQGEAGLVASVRDLVDLSQIGGFEFAGSSGRYPLWSFVHLHERLVIQAEQRPVHTVLWFALLQVLRFINDELVEVREVQVPPEHGALALHRWMEMLPPTVPPPRFKTVWDWSPPRVTLQVVHEGDHAASEELLRRLGIWFSAVSVGAFRGDGPEPKGWIALDDAPLCEPGLVGLNLTDVRCEDAAFGAAASVLSRFDQEIARVRGFYVE